MTSRHILYIILLTASINLSAQWERVSDLNVGVQGMITYHDSNIFLRGSQQGYRLFRFSNAGDMFTDLTSNMPEDLGYLFSYKGDLYAPFIRTIYKSEDDGVTWTTLASLEIENNNGAILKLTSDGDLLYASSNRRTIYRSLDNGNSWESIVIDDPNNIQIINFAATGSDWFCVIAGEGVRYSNDQGSTWESKNPATAITSVYNYNGVIFGLTYNGVFRFDGNSKSWEAVNSGLPNDGSFQIASTIYGSGDDLYMGVNELLSGSLSKLYHSNNNGDSWTALNLDGLPTTNSASSYDFISSDGDYLYYYYYGLLDGENTGLYKYSLDGITDITDQANPMASSFKLSQNYPNPFNPVTTINYSIEREGFVKLGVYDVLGNEITTLVNDYRTAGNYRINFNASNLASGFYIYKLFHGNNTQSKKMFLIK